MRTTIHDGVESVTYSSVREKASLISRIFLIFVMALAAAACLRIVTFAEEPIFTEVVNPDEYTVGPGDKFRVDFWNSAQPTIEVTVTPEGFLLLPSVGRADVGNLTLTEARESLRKLLSGFYSDKEFSITLLGSRPVKVLVSGGVKRPGLYDGMVSQRVSELINKAGGFVPGASRRNIILSGGKKEIVVDYLKYERAGDFAGNPYLYAGSKINVPLVVDSATFVQVSGEVINPGGFEYKSGDKVGNLLSLAMGFSGRQGDSILIFRNSHTIMLPVSDSEFDIQSGDKVLVRKRAEKTEQKFFSISGEILMPGRFPLKEGLRLDEALKWSGGLSPRGDINSLVIYRKNLAQDTLNGFSSNESNNISFGSGNVPVALRIDRYYPNRMSEIKIFGGDSIVVPILTGTVGVYGMVKQPGLVEFVPLEWISGRRWPWPVGSARERTKEKLKSFAKVRE